MSSPLWSRTGAGVYYLIPERDIRQVKLRSDVKVGTRP
jgi:hypothetical protein